MQRNILPEDPTPLHYNLCIQPNFETFAFTGEVTIDLSFKNPASLVTLNAAELVFHEASLTEVSSGSIQKIDGAAVKLDDPNERASLQFASSVSGEAKLHIKYTGTLNDKMRGFYRSKYTYRGETLYLGTTQFEAVDARRALPCWDEPARKATFQVALICPADHKVLSNTEELSREAVENNLVKVTFERTPKMSSYLLAWTVAKFECIERVIKKTRGGTTKVRIFATDSNIKQGEFALEVACRVLPLYENFFGSDYQLSKADLLAIPDFAAGAMENWGLITYRETALLCDESSSAIHRQWVAIVVAHELAHQWFGNLVTMDWWKELWLNESFATWIEYFAVDTLFPDWNIFTQFVNDEAGRAMELDGLKSSHPVEVDVINAQEIDEIFDAISYSKGGTLLRMVVNFIGIEAFRSGLEEYLAYFKFGNATTVDLWRFLGKASNKDLTGIMATWTGKQGYPVLYARYDSNDKVQVEQHRFFSTGKAAPEDDETVWNIPLIVKTPAAEVSSVVSGRIFDISVGKHPWVKVNSNQSAFVRVCYTDEMLQALKEPLANKKISAIDRLGLVADYHAFATAGLAPSATAIELLRSFTNEDDFTVWSAIASLEQDIRSLLGKKGEDLMDRFCHALYQPALKKLGMEVRSTDNHRESQLRALLLSRLSAAKDPAVLQVLHDLFESREAKPIPADIRTAVYAAVVKKEGENGWEMIRTLYEKSDDAMERARYLRALGSPRDRKLLEKALAYALSDKVRPQDAMYVMITVSANPDGAQAYTDMVIKQFDLLFEKFPGMVFARLLKFVENITTVEHAEQLDAFWTTVDEAKKSTAQRSFTQGVEGIRVKAAWAQRDTDALLKVLSE